MRESKIEAHLVKRVRALGGEIRKVKWIGRRGAPDRLVMIPRPVAGAPAGTTWGDFWIELKATNVPAEPHQLREHERMRAAGMSVFVLDSIEAIDELLA